MITSYLPAEISGLQREVVGWDDFLRLRDTAVKTAQLQKERLPSAVAVCFIPPNPSSARARILLVRRSSKLRSHAGQIGFAGGRRDAGDETPVDTVLRELGEETGIPKEAVTTIGSLPPSKALDGSAIVPVVLLAQVQAHEIRPEPAEVEAVFLCDWQGFAAGKGQLFEFTLFGKRRQSWLYRPSDGPLVWGLTAGILAGANMT